MPTDDEKLCMAIVNNSTISNINWAGVGAALGGLKVNSVQKRWKRFKDVSAAENTTNRPPEKTVKIGANGSKKRDIAEVSGEEEETARRLPARKAKGKKAKFQTPISDEEEGNGELAVKGEESKIDEVDFVEYDNEEA
jgi:hypothetical protein